MNSRFSTSQRSARESSDHLGNHSSGIYRLSRFSASSEAGKAKQLQAGLRVHIRTTRLRELQCSHSLAHWLVKVNAYSCAVASFRKLRSGGWEPHRWGWEPAWWQSSGAKHVSSWISQWWKMKCTQPSETKRQTERWAANTEPFTHTYIHINTLTICCLSLFWPHHHPHALN